MRKNVRVAKRERTKTKRAPWLKKKTSWRNVLTRSSSFRTTSRTTPFRWLALAGRMTLIAMRTTTLDSLNVKPVGLYYCWFSQSGSDFLSMTTCRAKGSLLAGNDPIGPCDSLFNIHKIKRRGRRAQNPLKESVTNKIFWRFKPKGTGLVGYIWKKKCGSDGLILSKPGQQQDTTDDCSRLCRSWLSHARLLFSRPSQAHSTI